MYIKEVTRKYIFIGLLILIIIGVIVANILAKKQDEEFATEDFLYNQALQLYKDGDYERAQLLVSELTIERADSEIVNYLAGLIAASNNEYESASILMQKSLDINPYKVENAIFMLQFGEILFLAKRYEDAKIVLNRCKDAGWTPEDYPDYQEQVQNMLTQIENS